MSPVAAPPWKFLITSLPNIHGTLLWLGHTLSPCPWLQTAAAVLYVTLLAAPSQHPNTTFPHGTAPKDSPLAGLGGAAPLPRPQPLQAVFLEAGKSRTSSESWFLSGCCLQHPWLALEKALCSRDSLLQHNRELSKEGHCHETGTTGTFLGQEEGTASTQSSLLAAQKQGKRHPLLSFPGSCWNHSVIQLQGIKWHSQALALQGTT